MTTAEDYERVEVRSAAELRAWLEAHHAQREGVWLVTFKRHSGDAYIPHSEVIDELVCFGWTDGAMRKLDTDRVMQLIAPRRTHHWAKTYKERAARLECEGRMRSPGLAMIAESKRRGLWDAMADVDALSVPDDLAIALDAHPPASGHFAAFAPSYRRNVLRWIAVAKSPGTRAKRVETAATLAAANEKVRHLA